MIIRTISGTEYLVEGRSITRRKAGEEPRTFQLITLGDRHVRYTDGEMLYTSSPRTDGPRPA